MQDYLIKYGYLKQPDHRIGNALSMKDLRVAIKKLQRIAGLKETGDISDLKTLAMVKKPRCGVQDFGPSDIARRKKRYALEGSYWRKTVSKPIRYNLRMLLPEKKEICQQYEREKKKKKKKNQMCKLEFATSETRRPRGTLDRVNFRKDFWDCYWEQGKELANSKRE